MSVPAALGPAHALSLDLPTLTPEQPVPLARLAVFADPWPGAVAVWCVKRWREFQPHGVGAGAGVIGETLDDLPAGPTARWQPASFRVKLYGGALSSMPDTAVLAGANVAAVRHAGGALGGDPVRPGRTDRPSEPITLSRLLRGQAGSEWAIEAGARGRQRLSCCLIRRS